MKGELNLERWVTLAVEESNQDAEKTTKKQRSPQGQRLPIGAHDTIAQQFVLCKFVAVCVCVIERWGSSSAQTSTSHQTRGHRLALFFSLWLPFQESEPKNRERGLLIQCLIETYVNPFSSSFQGRPAPARVSPLSCVRTYGGGAKLLSRWEEKCI